MPKRAFGQNIERSQAHCGPRQPERVLEVVQTEKRAYGGSQ